MISSAMNAKEVAQLEDLLLSSAPTWHVFRYINCHNNHLLAGHDSIRVVCYYCSTIVSIAGLWFIHALAESFTSRSSRKEPIDLEPFTFVGEALLKRSIVKKKVYFSYSLLLFFFSLLHSLSSPFTLFFFPISYIFSVGIKHTDTAQVGVGVSYVDELKWRVIFSFFKFKTFVLR